jgi:hypothetical protein
VQTNSWQGALTERASSSGCGALLASTLTVAHPKVVTTDECLVDLGNLSAGGREVGNSGPTADEQRRRIHLCSLSLSLI